MECHIKDGLLGKLLRLLCVGNKFFGLSGAIPNLNLDHWVLELPLYGLLKPVSFVYNFTSLYLILMEQKQYSLHLCGRRKLNWVWVGKSYNKLNKLCPQSWNGLPPLTLRQGAEWPGDDMKPGRIWQGSWRHLVTSGVPVSTPLTGHPGPKPSNAWSGLQCHKLPRRCS